MADVAARLRVAREEAGLSIEEVSARTKIKPTILLAIERGAFEQIPGGEFFTRAFLRTYARELHLPMDEITADYESTRPAPAVPPAPQEATSHPAVAIEEASPVVRAWPVAALLVAGTVLLFVMTRSTPVETELQPVATTGSSAQAAPPIPAATTGSAEPESLKIAIRPTRRLWVTGTADGKRVLFRMLQPGEEVTLEARESMTFRLGDAGAFTYALNGVPAKPPGRDGEVREFVINRRNSSELVR